MSRSGVALESKVIPTFEELKLGKKHLYIIYKFSSDNKTIEVDKVAEKVPKRESREEYDDFVAALPENGTRYAIYDFSFELSAGEGTRNKIILFAWSPDNAPIKSKMLCASSKDVLRRSLTGIHSEIQGTDYSEISYDTVLARFVSKAT